MYVCMYVCACVHRRGSRGGGAQGGLAPHLLGKTREARYRLKRTPKHTKYAQIFKKNIVRWGGGQRGHKGKFLGRGTPNTPPPPRNGPQPPPPPSVPSLRRLTPFIIPQTIILATFILSLLVYISNVFASLVVQFQLFTFCGPCAHTMFYLSSSNILSTNSC